LTKPNSYKNAGVDIEAGYEVIRRIRSHVDSTKTPGVIGSIGAFSGLFREDFTKYKEPLLVSATDGVGTKLKVAIELDKHDTVGIDLVAMSVNDLVCCGAKPLFFLDYIALEKTIPEKVEKIVAGIAEGCRQADCALIGGETAEMNDMYKPGDYDLAGFAVGVVDKEKVIDGSTVNSGDVIVGLPSTGVHSNGYSLARKVLDKADYLELLTPTKIYVKEILAYLNNGINIKAIANITGGGLFENVERVLKDDLDAEIDAASWEPLPIFKKIQQKGNIAAKEMYSAFNMGIGMVVVVNNADAEKLKGVIIGEIVSGSKKVIIKGL
jgi:phosphoribosylformylglycinamidine cyclo-ligase